MARSNSTQVKGGTKRTAQQAEAHGVAHDAIVAALRAVNAANPKLVKRFTRIMRKTCRCSLPEARDAAVGLVLRIRMDEVYVGRPGALRSLDQTKRGAR